MCHIYSSLSKIDVNELFVSKDDFPNVQFKFLKLMLHVQTTWEESEAGRQASARGRAREAAGTTSRLSAPGLGRGLAGSSISRHSVLGLVRGLLSTLRQGREVQRKRCFKIQNM